MTLLEFVQLLRSTGFPVAYSHFEDPTPDPPFICYTIPEQPHFTADNRVYHKISDIDIELYTAYKDFEAEKKLEDVLDANNIPYYPYETYIEGEKLYQKIYEVRLI